MSQGPNAVLEVNGSFEASKFRAKLFLNSSLELQMKGKDEEIKSSLESGDVIRLFHKEASGYMTVFERNVDLLMPALPDFL